MSACVQKDREPKVDDKPCNGGGKSKSQYQQQRRRRNPAVLIRWIEDHPYNPYPNKIEKHELAFYSGMTQRQLNDWFANARRNIKKVGYESWKKKHSGFSAILSGIPPQGSHFPVQSTSQPLVSASQGYKLPTVSNVYGSSAPAASGTMHSHPGDDCHIATTAGTHSSQPSYYSSLGGMKFVQLSHGPASYTPTGTVAPPLGDNIVRPTVQTGFPFSWAHPSSYKTSNNHIPHNDAGPCVCTPECQPLPYPPLSRASSSSSLTSEDTGHHFAWSPGSSLSTSQAPSYGYIQSHSLTTTSPLMQSSGGSQWSSPDSTLNRVTNEETDSSTTDEGYFDDAAGIPS